MVSPLWPSPPQFDDAFYAKVARHDPRAVLSHELDAVVSGEMDWQQALDSEDEYGPTTDAALMSSNNAPSQRPLVASTASMDPNISSAVNVSSSMASLSAATMVCSRDIPGSGNRNTTNTRANHNNHNNNHHHNNNNNSSSNSGPNTNSNLGGVNEALFTHLPATSASLAVSQSPPSMATQFASFFQRQEMHAFDQHSSKGFQQRAGPAHSQLPQDDFAAKPGSTSTQEPQSSQAQTDLGLFSFAPDNVQSLIQLRQQLQAQDLQAFGIDLPFEASWSQLQQQLQQQQQTLHQPSTQADFPGEHARPHDELETLGLQSTPERQDYQLELLHPNQHQSLQQHLQQGDQHSDQQAHSHSEQQQQHQQQQPSTQSEDLQAMQMNGSSMQEVTSEAQISELRQKLQMQMQTIPRESVSKLATMIQELQVEAIVFTSPDVFVIDFAALSAESVQQLSQAVQREPKLNKLSTSPRMGRRNSSKVCDSCKTTKTPVWREADGRYFCNACGLRYSKLLLRCRNPRCRYVPHHADLGKPCGKCGKPLPRATEREARKH